MKRRDPVIVAALMVVCFLVVLGVWGLGSGGEKTTSASRYSMVMFKPASDRPRTLDISVTYFEETYVTIDRLPLVGAPVRLFPPLSAPKDIPWPLPPFEDIELFGDRGLAIPEGADGFLVLRFVDDPTLALAVPDDLARNADSLKWSLGADVYDLSRLP